ncbi:MAG: hypothetical protein ACRYF8_10230 [Janthinobacterium lividum]
MTDTTIEVPHEIFEQPLEDADARAIEALVNQHKGNAALTQQLALDASRVLASSQERLAKQRGAGFFKRLSNKVSGKTGQDQLQNQVDTLQMQKFAWHYLKQLQQQNLINAQSIAVIRNNLGTMNEYIIETREFLSQAVDRINSRLVQVENHASFNNWSLHIEANKRRFKSIPRNLLVLHLTYDFMRSHRGVVLTSRDVNHLVVTLDKLGIDCDEDVRLLDFIIELIENIELAGIERFREMIALGFDDHVVDSHFIQRNISGIGFNALYFLSDQYERIVSLIDDEDICRSDGDRENIIAKLFGEEFSGLSTTYGIRDLIGEVIGGSALAIDIYKDVNGLNVIEGDEEREHQEGQPLSLTSELPEIQVHSFFDAVSDEETRRTYLRLFALAIEGSATLSKPGLEFLEHLAAKAGCSDIVGQIAQIADSPRKLQDYLSVMQALLNEDDRTYTWLLDAFFLLTLCGRKIENPQVARILATLKPAQFRDNFPHMQTLLRETEEKPLLDSAAKMAAQTRGWKNIVRYRSLSFERTYEDIGKKLHTASRAATTLSFDLLEVSSKASDHSFFMEPFDDGFFAKVGSAVLASACSVGRGLALSSLNTVRKKATDLISEHSGALGAANGMIRRVNLPTIDFDSELGYSDFDLDNSASNDDWYEQFCRYERQVDDALSAFSAACSAADRQIDLFKAGEFDKSVVEMEAQDRAARERARQEEQLEKSAAVVEIEGRAHRFSIEWQNLENPPCDPENVRQLKTNGKVWLLVDDDGVFHHSEDGQHWQIVRPDPQEEKLNVRKLSVVDGVWILIAGYGESFFFSKDGLTWQRSQVPELPGSYGYSETEDVAHFNGQWLWRFTERAEYTYVEKGIIFDSTRTSTYYKPLIYSAERLDSAWTRWDGTPNLAEGVEVKSMRSLPGLPCLLLFCSYNYSYVRARKKNGAKSFVNYYLPGKNGRSCTWDSDKDHFDDPLVTRMSGKLMCICWDQYLTSDKGYDWKLQSQELRVDSVFHLERLTLFTQANDAQRIYLSADGEAFKEFMLEEGRWRYLAAKDHAVLSVYELNDHETFLRIGRIVCEPVA